MRLRRIGMLRVRDGDRRHARAKFLRRHFRKAAPARADLEHMIARLQLQIARDRAILGKLRVLQRLIRRRRRSPTNTSSSGRARPNRNHCRGRSAPGCCASSPSWCSSAACGAGSRRTARSLLPMASVPTSSQLALKYSSSVGRSGVSNLAVHEHFGKADIAARRDRAHEFRDHARSSRPSARAPCRQSAACARPATSCRAARA